MRYILAVVFTLSLSAGAFSQGLLSSTEHRRNSASNTYSEVFISTGTGSSIGINHLKDLSPRTSVVIGASYTNFRMSPLRFEQYQGFPTSFTNLRSEFRYFVTPKDQRLTAFVYGAVNNSFINFPAAKPMYNLGLEVGGEVRYKIAENLFFHARTTIYRSNGYLNPYSMSPFPMNSDAPLR